MVYEMAGTDAADEQILSMDTADDTSAGIPGDAGPDESVGGVEKRSPRGSRRRWVTICILLVAIVAVSAAVAGGLVASRNRGGDSASNESSTDSQSTEDDTDTGQTTSDENQNGTLLPVPDGDPKEYEVRVVKVTPHDKEAFLQGFEYDDTRDIFFESTGLYGGRSSIRHVEVNTGKVLKSSKLPSPNLFGEGMTLGDDNEIYMLSWKSGRGFIFDQDTLELKREWEYEGEGWGLTTDRSSGMIYMSDGTNEIRKLKSKTLEEVGERLKVMIRGNPARRLNELEFICGEIWANVWQSKSILRIDPETGNVRSVIRVPNLPRNEDVDSNHQIDVLNGIAFDEKTRRLWITGKLWPKVYQVNITDDTFDKQCEVAAR